MCLPPDVSTPALPASGRRRDANPSAWSTDPRGQANWGAPSSHNAGTAWPSWMEFFNLPPSGFDKDDASASNVIEAAPLGSLLASALAQQEVPKTWQPQANWATQQNNSFYCGPQPVHSSYGGGVNAGAALMQSTADPPDVDVSAAAKSMMTAAETLSSVASRGLESLGRAKEEEKSQTGSLFDDLYQDGRSEQENAATKLCAHMAKTSKAACHKLKQGVRPGVKMESTIVKDVCMGESDAEASDDDIEGAPVISEKRRKRMLSNRASAQRSRQRRQERLDTLEVLVAQLRVENAALKSKASTAAASVKKLEDENRILRERLDAKDRKRGGQVSLSKDDADNDNQSLQTTGGNNMSGVGNSKDGVTISVKTRTGDSDSISENSDPNKKEAELSTANITVNSNLRRIVYQPSKKKSSCEDASEKEWSFNPSFSTPFDEEIIESVGDSTCKVSRHKSASRMGTMTEYAQEYESMKSVASLPQSPAFTQEMDAFDIDLEHSPDIDKKLLDSVEEIWLDGFSDVCFK